MSAAASVALQRVVTARLAGSATLRAAGVTGVYDGASRGRTLPVLIVGPEVATDWGWKGAAGREHRFTVTLWAADDDAAAAKAMLATVEDELTAPMPTQGVWLVEMRWLKSVVDRTNDGRVRAVAEFRARTIEEN